MGNHFFDYEDGDFAHTKSDIFYGQACIELSAKNVQPRLVNMEIITYR